MINKYRAFIDGKFYYFDLQSLAHGLLTINIFEKLTHEEKMVSQWLEKGTQPDVFIGRQDKNGNDIYENDFVKEASWDKSLPFLVRFEELNNCGCCTDDSGMGFNLHGKNDDLIIVGNAHQS